MQGAAIAAHMCVSPESLASARTLVTAR